MVTHCANHAWRYFVRVTPPDMIQDLIHEFDNIIMDGIFTCIRPMGMKSGLLSDTRRDRASLLFRLPASLRGGGVVSLATIAPIAYVASQPKDLRPWAHFNKPPGNHTRRRSTT